MPFFWLSQLGRRRRPGGETAAARPQALADLYDRYGRLVYALILRVVKDTGIAEDLVQETFLRVWNRVHAFDAQKGSRSVRGCWRWPATARSTTFDRRAGASATRRVRGNRPPVALHRYGEDILLSDEARAVKAALEKLSANQRQVIELAYFEGLSQTEMAERMGQPLGTVKTWVRTALKHLRDELGEAVPA